MKTGSLILGVLKMAYNTLLSFFTITYCIVILVAVVYRIKRGVASSRSITGLSKAQDSPALISFKILVCRTCLYPASCFLAYVSSNISMMNYFFRKANLPALLAWQKAGYSSLGMLHLIAFLADPLVLSSLKGLFLRVEPKEAKYRAAISHQVMESEYSFEYLTLPLPTDSSALLLRQRMVKDFKKYI